MNATSTQRYVSKNDIDRITKAHRLLSDVGDVDEQTRRGVDTALERLDSLVPTMIELLKEERLCAPGESTLEGKIREAIQNPEERDRLIGEALNALDEETPNHDEIEDTLQSAQRDHRERNIPEDVENYLRGAYSLLVPGPAEAEI